MQMNAGGRVSCNFALPHIELNPSHTLETIAHQRDSQQNQTSTAMNPDRCYVCLNIITGYSSNPISIIIVTTRLTYISPSHSDAV